MTHAVTDEDLRNARSIGARHAGRYMFWTPAKLATHVIGTWSPTDPPGTLYRAYVAGRRAQLRELLAD